MSRSRVSWSAPPAAVVLPWLLAAPSLAHGPAAAAQGVCMPVFFVENVGQLQVAQ